MRNTLAIMVTVMYAISMYLYTKYLGHIPIRYSKLWYNYTTMIALVFIFLDDYFGINHWIQKQVLIVLKTLLIVNFILIILEQHLIINDTQTDIRFYALNGSVLVVTVMILLSSLRHGYFKQTR